MFNRFLKILIFLYLFFDFPIGAMEQKIINQTEKQYNQEATTALLQIMRENYKAGTCNWFSDENWEKIKLQLETGANPNCCWNKTLLMQSAIDQHKNYFYYLLQNGADPNSHEISVFHYLLKNFKKNTADLEMLKTLLQHGANPNAQSIADPITINITILDTITIMGAPLHIVVKNGNTDLIKILIKHGADVNLKVSQYNDKNKIIDYISPLALAILVNNFKAMKILCKNSASLTEINSSNINAFDFALKYSNELSFSGIFIIYTRIKISESKNLDLINQVKNHVQYINEMLNKILKLEHSTSNSIPLAIHHLEKQQKKLENDTQIFLNKKPNEYISPDNLALKIYNNYKKLLEKTD